MAHVEFDNEQFERKLQALKDSQESIQALSSWCLERRQHHKKIVATWLQVLKKVKVEHRLTLFYLANDVIQYSKRKNFEFVESWGTTLQRATTMVRDEKVKHRILRIFKIWDQRQVYDEEFLADLSGLISAAPKKKPEPQPAAPPEEFQAPLLISTMRSCANLEQATDARLRDLRDANVDIDNAEELCGSLKDRRHVEDAEKEVDNAVRNVENYVKALESEIRERTQVLELLEQADQFYETQRGEVKIVTNAYRNFGSRVKNLKKKLDELLPTLISPIPSPDINAPSPSPDSDIELPGDDMHSLNQSTDMMLDVAPPSMYNSYGQDYDPNPVPAPELTAGNSNSDFTTNFSSFMGGNVDFDMRNLFNDRSETPSNGNQRYNESSEAMPIEVINMRPSKLEQQNSEDFSISNFLKSVLPGGGGDGADNARTDGRIPGLGLDAIDSRAESPQRPDYGILGGRINTPPSITGRIGGPGTPQNNHQMVHSTPLPLSRNLINESHTPSPYSSQNSLSNMTTLPFVDSAIISSPVNPLPPPPLPPPIFLDEENCYNKLPPKFPTWTSANETTKTDKWDEKGKLGLSATWSDDNDNKNKSQQWGESGDERWESANDTTWTSGVRGKNDVLSETPESPPIYEKSSFNTPIEYNDVDAREPILSSDADVDHRVRTIPMPEEMHLSHRLVKAADVDHRNLISLTGSPANNASNSNEAGTSRPTNNNVWTSADQNYRRQQGDIVESVDMEMSDEEGEGKQKCRVLVDVRSQQDRDLRIPVGPPMQDMDMRMIPLPGNPMPRGGPMLQDIRPPPPPPLPPPQFHRGQNDFRGPDFRPPFIPDMRQNPPIFMQNPQHDFHPMSQDFRQNQGQDFHPRPQEYDFHEGLQTRIPGPGDFMADPQIHGRYPTGNQPQDHHLHHHHHQQQQQQQQQHREPVIFQRNPNDRGRGRGFPRNRRFGIDEQNQSRNIHQNNRRGKPQGQSILEKAPLDSSPTTNRGPLLPPPDTCVILDDEGVPITRPDLDTLPKSSVPLSQQLRESVDMKISLEKNESKEPRSGDSAVLLKDAQNSSGKVETSDKLTSASLPEGSKKILDDVSAVKTDTKTVGLVEALTGAVGNLIAGDSLKDDRSGEKNSTKIDEPPRQLSEHLEALMNSSKIGNSNTLKRQANGDFVGVGDKTLNDNDAKSVEETLAMKKRTLLPNGPSLLPSPTDLHPVLIYDYNDQNPHNNNFRPRLPGIGGPMPNTQNPPFPVWRGISHPIRPRGGFRGAPRAPWIDRNPRGPPPPLPPANFMPRGNNRGIFRGPGGFRGRGRGNW